jgi:hypothetical protein
MWARAQRLGYIQRRLQAAGALHRSFRIAVSIVVSLFLLGVVVELGLTMAGGQENFQTLRSDLAEVHLSPTYHLIATRQAGSDCGGSCSLTQTWVWTPTPGHGSSAACSDVQRAIESAFSRADANSPIPANTACDYYAILGDLLHPGQGKRAVDGIVFKCHAPTAASCKIELTASYG